MKAHKVVVWHVLVCVCRSVAVRVAASVARMCCILGAGVHLVCCRVNEFNGLLVLAS
jgi:hypothetical protein